MFFDYIMTNISSNPKMEFINKLAINNELKKFCELKFNYEYKQEPMINDRNNYIVAIKKKFDNIE